MRPQDVIRRPLLTEKVTGLTSDFGTYAFEVATSANKIQIADAVEAQFKVKVAEVRIVNVHGKWRRQGRFMGRRADWKKAYVRLQAGQGPIEFFEGV
jgi:large subunit ribosomal protein L23